MEQLKVRLGKRGKNKYPAHKTLKDSYLIYKDKMVVPKTKFSEVSDKHRLLSEKEFRKVAEQDILLPIMERILNHSETFYPPCALGEMRVKKKKMPIGLLESSKNLKIDWGYFQKTGKIKKHLNEHRDYNRYGFYWLCKKGPIGKGLYKFSALRKHNRKLTELLTTTNIDYFN
jgi:hypothetical protein